MFSVFKNLNKFSGKSKLVDNVAIFCARTLAYIAFISLVAWFVYVKEYYFLFGFILAAILGRALNKLVHLAYKEQRPAYLEGTKVLIPVPKSYSFPSGHASFFFAIAFFLVFYNLYLFLTLFIIAFIIGIARVFCGVHWFRDVLASVLVGFLSAAIIYGLLNYFK